MEQLKYNIKKRLAKLNRTDHERVMKKLLKATGNVSRTTFYRWCATRPDERFEIPYTIQQSIATIFGCTVDDLTNHVNA